MSGMRMTAPSVGEVIFPDTTIRPRKHTKNRKKEMKCFPGCLIFSVAVSISLLGSGCGIAAETMNSSVTMNSSIEESTEDADIAEGEIQDMKVTSESLKNGVWNEKITNTYAGENVSPELSWNKVDGAAEYAIYMIDPDGHNWLHWRVTGFTGTHLEEGEMPAGRECFKNNGSTIPEDTIKQAKKSDATLFGAITSTPGQKSPIVTLRKELNVYGNLRPIKSFEGVKCLYDDVDFLIVRENTEGLYSQDETVVEEDEKVIANKIITKKASKRICELAFEEAIKDNRKSVVASHKANVLKKTDGLFRDTFYEVAKRYPNMEVNDYYVDATSMFIVQNPQMFDVIVAGNLYGDILSDEAAGLVGGLGLAPSGNIGDDNGLFEPVHGSAPDIAGKNISNPIAMLLSTSMMLRYLKYDYEAKLLEKACREVLRKGNIRTPDLGGNNKTYEMADAIVCNLKELEK